MRLGHPPVVPGCDVFIDEAATDLRGQSLAVLAGSGAVTSLLIPTITALRSVKDLRIVALFGAEHGLRGAEPAGKSVGSTRYGGTDLPVYSLYGEQREPTDEMLHGIDTIVVDFQDVGLRYYTYASTVRAVLQAAARRNLQVILLDRPNPLGGVLLDGPVADPAFLSFVGAAQVPIRHGLTLGELARWMNDHEGIGAPLRVIPMRGWRREFWFDATGLTWVAPSPNIPTDDTCLLYAATCLIEGTPVSEGRGTAQPFKILGAPWIEGEMLAAHLNGLDLPGVRFGPTWFRPSMSKYAEQTCGGVQLHIVDRYAFAGVPTGLHLVSALRTLYPEHMEWIRDDSGSYVVDLLLGSDAPRRAIEHGDRVDDVVASWQAGIKRFDDERRDSLIYADPTTRPARVDSPLSQTERVNARTAAIDTLSALEILRLISEEDATVPAAVARELPAIAACVERVAYALRNGGRLIYAGAGSSGRMGVLDAAECYPTYGVDSSQVLALLAGGPAAMTSSVEAAEDNAAQGGEDVDALDVNGQDVVVGIAASGHTPYVVGVLRRARERGAYAVALVGNSAGLVASAADLVIAPETGPEVIAGSTRMKAGTAQKLVLNMISTTAMILTGRTFGNLMVNMRAVNDKLRERMRRIVAEAGQVDLEAAEAALAASDYDMKTAIVMLLSGVDAAEARLRLDRASGVVRDAV
jgi:N-acetylmuramic acid 6-phosphate etherase